MPRYIDADEFVKRVIQYPRQSTKTIGLALADTPTADVVEVVRCRDCKYYNSKNSYCEGIGNWFGLMNEWSDNGFCYKGERKERRCRNDTSTVLTH